MPKKKTKQSTNEDTEYEVEEILRVKEMNGQYFYLVKWKDFSHSQNTWEPAENMLNCDLAMDRFLSKQGILSSVHSAAVINDHDDLEEDDDDDENEEEEDSHNHSHSHYNSDTANYAISKFNASQMAMTATASHPTDSGIGRMVRPGSKMVSSFLRKSSIQASKATLVAQKKSTISKVACKTTRKQFISQTSREQLPQKHSYSYSEEEDDIATRRHANQKSTEFINKSTGMPTERNIPDKSHLLKRLQSAVQLHKQSMTDQVNNGCNDNSNDEDDDDDDGNSNGPITANQSSSFSTEGITASSTLKDASNISLQHRFFMAMNEIINPTSNNIPFPQTHTQSDDSNREQAVDDINRKNSKASLSASTAMLSTRMSSTTVSSTAMKKDPAFQERLHRNLQKSQEKVSKAWGPPIIVINEVDDQGLPEDFIYTDVMIYGQDVPRPSPAFVVGCQCFDCFASGSPRSMTGGMNYSAATDALIHPDIANRDNENEDGDICLCRQQHRSHNGRVSFAYDANELLRDPLSTDAIYECNYNCFCGPSCGNRVVQRGRQVELDIFRCADGIKGWGVRTRQFIPAGRFIATYLGELITQETANERLQEYLAEMAPPLIRTQGNKSSLSSMNDRRSLHSSAASTHDASSSVFKKESAHFYLFDLDYAAVDDDDGQDDQSGQDNKDKERGLNAKASCIYTVDSKEYGNISHFFNHSCEPNLLVRPCFLASQDRRFHDICFFACRDIQAGEELCFDYAGRQGSTSTSKPFSRQSKGKKSKRADLLSDRPMIECLCGGARCRKYVYL